MIPILVPHLLIPFLLYYHPTLRQLAFIFLLVLLLIHSLIPFTMFRTTPTLRLLLILLPLPLPNFPLPIHLLLQTGSPISPTSPMYFFR